MIKIRLLIIAILCILKSSTYAYDFEVDGIYYNTTSNNEVEVTYGENKTNSYSGDVIVPMSVSNGNKTYTVKSIGNSAFYGCKNLSSITLPNSITIIGSSAFAESEKCKSINIPEGVITIKDGAFYECIGLTSLEIPKSVTSIAVNAFYGCSCNMESISVNVNNSYYDSRSNCNAIIRKSDMKLLLGCKNTVIPSGVKIIGPYAFLHCVDLKSISFPTSLIEIESAAFYGCSNINSITIPYSVKTISGSAFYGCGGLQSIKVDVNNSYYDSRDNCNAIINKADKSLIRGCINTIVPNGITSIEFGAFSNINELITIDLPQSITKIGSFAFSDCSNLSSIELPQSLISIDQGAFINCSNLSSITIPSTITSISSLVFEYCRKLSFVESKIKIPFDIGWNCFGYISANAILKVPKGTKSEYYNYSNWVSSFKEIIEETECYSLSIKSTGCGYATYNGTSLKNNTSTFAVEEGASATIMFAPDDGYRIKIVKVNGTDVTSRISNNQYTISNITSDMTVEVVFEAIPPITYTLSIKATGSGSASYNSTIIRGNTISFTVNDGTSATITFTPDNGYRIANLYVNNINVTSGISNNKYTISNISRNTTIEVTFEAIPVTTYLLSIKSTGGGSVSYNGTTIRSKTSYFIVNEGTSVSITLTPDNGYRIKSVKENDTNVTLYVSNGTYNINSVTRNTTVEVEFEVIPPTTYTLSIKSTGNGSVSYDGNTIRSKISTFTVNEGASATISFTPDTGYRVKSVKVNSADVTSSVSNNQYIINNITTNTTLEIEFETIPITTYTLTVKATGSGYASCNGNSIRGETSTFTMEEGTSATITFIPDNGNRIKSAKVNNTDVTSSIVDNTYTIRSISSDTFVEVEFEAIPPTTYSLIISATGNGNVTYNNTTLKNQTQTFTVTEGSYATITISPEDGYRIKSVVQDGSDVTASVDNNQYTTKMITSNTTLEVTFEAIPIPIYTLSVTASGNGTVNCMNTIVKNKTEAFSIEEGTTVIVTFSPDNGYQVASVKVNNSDVTAEVSNNSYSINMMKDNTTLEVAFEAMPTTVTADGVNYIITSQTEQTVSVSSGNYGQMLTVPATVTGHGKTWTVTGIEANALSGNMQLAAIIWNPEVAFTATVNNPNLLLYVKAERYAPSAIQNVVVNGIANSIVLAEAQSGNDFYCPQMFTARRISYTHIYKMTTGIGESQGWETIALPFDVQIITHETKGEIVPFTNWTSGSMKKPFWLYQLTGSGFREADAIKAYIPYIISMPNNSQYSSEWLLNGNVTFSATNVTISPTDNMQTTTYSSRTFVPNYAVRGADEGLFALNAVNEFVANNSGMTDGSKFVLNMRQVHPFEAYMTSSSNARTYFDIFDDLPTDIREKFIVHSSQFLTGDRVFDLQGRRVEYPSKKGVYIVNGKKMIIK